MYRASGMNMDERDALIYQLWRKRFTYAQIARRVGMSVGGVRCSLKRTAEKMTGLRDRPPADRPEAW
jgi:DNA-directed RNA polymerase specialized sigma24 family protein